MAGDVSSCPTSADCHCTVFSTPTCSAKVWLQMNFHKWVLKALLWKQLMPFRGIYRSCKWCQVTSSRGKFYIYKQISLKSSQSILCLQAKCFSSVLYGMVLLVMLVSGAVVAGRLTGHLVAVPLCRGGDVLLGWPQGTEDKCCTKPSRTSGLLLHSSIWAGTRTQRWPCAAPWSWTQWSMAMRAPKGQLIIECLSLGEVLKVI